jgi:hypothetical protein
MGSHLPGAERHEMGIDRFTHNELIDGLEFAIQVKT